MAGTIGVILSLLFVGLELRQNGQLARAEVRQGLADRNAQVLNSIAENPELARAWTQRWSPQASDTVVLTPGEATQALFALLGMLRHVENVYLQYLEGVVDESVLNSYAFQNNTVFTFPKVQEAWPNLRPLFDARFVEAFEERYGL